MNGRRHIFRKDRRKLTKLTCVCNLPTALYDQKKARQGEGEMMILENDSSAEGGRDTCPFKCFVYTPSPVLGLS